MDCFHYLIPPNLVSQVDFGKKAKEIRTHVIICTAEKLRRGGTFPRKVMMPMVVYTISRSNRTKGGTAWHAIRLPVSCNFLADIVGYPPCNIGGCSSLALPVPRQLADADPHVRSNLSLNAEKKG